MALFVYTFIVPHSWYIMQPFYVRNSFEFKVGPDTENRPREGVGGTERSCTMP